MYIENTYWKDTYIVYTYMYIDFLCMYECRYMCMYELDSLCIYVFIHVKFIYDCNIWLYYQLTTVTDTYFRFLEENVVGMSHQWWKNKPKSPWQLRWAWVALSLLELIATKLQTLNFKRQTLTKFHFTLFGGQ